MIDKTKINVKYRCAGCSLNGSVTVRARSDTETIQHWVHYAVSECGRHHLRIKPLCTYGKIDLLIPVFEDSPTIGQPGEQELTAESKQKIKDILSKPVDEKHE